MLQTTCATLVWERFSAPCNIRSTQILRCEPLIHHDVTREYVVIIGMSPSVVLGISDIHTRDLRGSVAARGAKRSYKSDFKAELECYDEG